MRQRAAQARPRRVRVPIDHAHRRARRERPLARQHLVEDAAQAVEIAALVGRLRMALLGAHVVRSAENLARARDRGMQPHLLRQAKIDQRERAVVAEHDVRGLQIAMQDAGSVDRRERACYLPRVVDAPSRAQARVLNRSPRLPAPKYSIAM